MKTLFSRSSDAHKTRIRAVEYAAHEWPVAPLAVPRNGHCPCKRGNCVEPHLAGTATVDPAEVDDIWTRDPWSIALVTSRFDVIDLPADAGAPLNHKLVTSCPTATAPHGRRWHFVMETGSISPELVSAVRGRLYSGPADWVPASPTWTDETGRMGWVVEPHMTRWQPYRRMDLIDMVLGKLPVKVSPGLPGVADTIELG
jgi:hypothetical protein